MIRYYLNNTFNFQVVRITVFQTVLITACYLLESSKECSLDKLLNYVDQ